MISKHSTTELYILIPFLHFSRLDLNLLYSIGRSFFSHSDCILRQVLSLLFSIPASQVVAIMGYATIVFGWLINHLIKNISGIQTVLCDTISLLI